jgi:hypothetical protein
MLDGVEMPTRRRVIHEATPHGEVPLHTLQLPEANLNFPAASRGMDHTVENHVQYLYRISPRKALICNRKAASALPCHTETDLTFSRNSLAPGSGFAPIKNPLLALDWVIDFSDP